MKRPEGDLIGWKEYALHLEEVVSHLEAGSSAGALMLKDIVWAFRKYSIPPQYYYRISVFADDINPKSKLNIGVCGCLTFEDRGYTYRCKIDDDAGVVRFSQLSEEETREPHRRVAIGGISMTARKNARVKKEKANIGIVPGALDWGYSLQPNLPLIYSKPGGWDRYSGDLLPWLKSTLLPEKSHDG